MNKQTKDERYNSTYMETAYVFSKLSHAVRKKVGCVAVKDGNIIAHGWNGMPKGFPNVCEDTTDGQLVTKREVLHAELNTLSKLAKGTQSSEGSDIYVTLSPCVECSKLIIQAGIKRVFYHEEYRDTSGIALLIKAGVEVNKLELHT
jgi:dCMP deaminase